MRRSHRRSYKPFQTVNFFYINPYNGLQLNVDKSEVVFLGTAAQLRSVAEFTTVDVTGRTLKVASRLNSHDVTIDSHLRFDIHARNVAPAGMQLPHARHLRCLLTHDVARTIACSTVASRLDYCNALLCVAPEPTLDELQRVQNNLARIVCQPGRRTDGGALLWSLHWLPLSQRNHIKDGIDSPQGSGHCNV